MDDFGLCLFFRKHLCQKCDYIFSWNKGALRIKKEAAIKITIKSNPKISAFRSDNICGCGMIFGQKWIRDAIGETGIRGMMDSDKVCVRACGTQGACKRIKAWPRRTIAGIYNNFQRLEIFRHDKTHELIDIGAPRLGCARQNFSLTRGRRKTPAFRKFLNGAKVFLVQGFRSPLNDFHAIIINGVVGGRYLNSSAGLL